MSETVYTNSHRDASVANRRVLRQTRVLVLSLALGLMPGCRSCGNQTYTPDQLYERFQNSVTTINVSNPDTGDSALGTGFFVAPDLLMTNEHVVRGMTEIFLFSGTSLAHVALYDAKNDLALIRLNTKLDRKVEVLEFAKDEETRVGDNVVVIGSPLGLDRSVTSGNVSAFRTFGNKNLLQLSAPISAGSSGSPVISNSGKVVGIAVGNIESGQNLNFAARSSAAIALLDKLNGASGLGIRATNREEILPAGTQTSDETHEPSSDNPVPDSVRFPLKVKAEDLVFDKFIKSLDRAKALSVLKNTEERLLKACASRLFEYACDRALVYFSATKKSKQLDKLKSIVWLKERFSCLSKEDCFDSNKFYKDVERSKLDRVKRVRALCFNPITHEDYFHCNEVLSREEFKKYIDKQLSEGSIKAMLYKVAFFPNEAKPFCEPLAKACINGDPDAHSRLAACKQALADECGLDVRDKKLYESALKLYVDLLSKRLVTNCERYGECDVSSARYGDVFSIELTTKKLPTFFKVLTEIENCKVGDFDYCSDAIAYLQSARRGSEVLEMLETAILSAKFRCAHGDRWKCQDLVEHYQLKLYSRVHPLDRGDLASHRKLFFKTLFKLKNRFEITRIKGLCIKSYREACELGGGFECEALKSGRCNVEERQ
jgi:hypothetical protein